MLSSLTEQFSASKSLPWTTTRTTGSQTSADRREQRRKNEEDEDQTLSSSAEELALAAMEQVDQKLKARDGAAEHNGFVRVYI